jgi:hypothetical protein
MWSEKDLLSFEKDAIFWSPDDPDEQFFGRIIYSMEQGIYVHVFKSATMAEKMSFWSNQSVESKPLVLHADIQDIGDATLFDGFMKNQQLGSAGPATQIMYFNHGLLGFHSNAPEEEFYTRVSLYVRNLEAWMGVNPFRFPSDGVDIREERAVVWSRPDPSEVEIRGLGKASINWVAKGPSRSITQSSATIESRPYLAFEFEQPVHYEEASRKVNCLLDMIETVADSCFPFDSIRFTSSTRSRKIGKSDKCYPLSAAFIGCRTSQENLTTIKYPQDAVFSLRDINDFNCAVEKWYSLCNSCAPAMRAYVSQRSEKSGYAESRFFMLASITESLHRELNPGMRLFENKIGKDKIQAVLDEVPEVVQEIVRAKLQFLNSPTYQSRLQALMDDATLIIEDLIGDASDQKEFVKQVKDWRNEQAHQTKPGKRYASRDGIDFVQAASKLKVLIDFQILLQLGIMPEKIAERMRACHRYWFYANNKTWRWQMTDQHADVDSEPAVAGGS